METAGHAGKAACRPADKLRARGTSQRSVIISYRRHDTPSASASYPQRTAFIHSRARFQSVGRWCVHGYNYDDLLKFQYDEPVDCQKAGWPEPWR